MIDNLRPQDLGDRPAATPERRSPALPRAVDASMTLLNEVMHQPLDPGYVAAARRRSTDPVSWRTRLATVFSVAILTGVGGWGVAAAVVDLRRPAPEAMKARQKLETQILDRENVARQLRGQIAADQATAGTLQSRYLKLQGDTELQAQVERLAALAGERPIAGPGLRIVLTDAATGGSGAGQLDPHNNLGTADGKVMDRDVQIAVNGLWASGAAAIAVNGQRLTALSAIRSAGPAILVDFVPLSPPYVIEALGDSTTLQTGFAEDLAGAYLKSINTNYHIGVDISAQSQLKLSAANEITLHKAKVYVPPSKTATGSAPAPGARSTSAGSRQTSMAPISTAPTTNSMGGPS